MPFRSAVLRLAGALPPVLPAQETASRAKATKSSVLGSVDCGAREERAKFTVELVLLFSAVMPAPEPFGRAMLVAPVFVVMLPAGVAS